MLSLTITYLFLLFIRLASSSRKPFLLPNASPSDFFSSNTTGNDILDISENRSPPTSGKLNRSPNNQFHNYNENNKDYHGTGRVSMEVVNYNLWNGRQASRLLWPKGVSGYYEIPYTIQEGDFTEWMEREMIIWSMRNIERGSNIRFRPFQKSDKNYIVFVNGEGCLSIVGRNPLESPQRVSLNIPTCMRRNFVMHEILHALGLYHEHQRPDANQYIEISKSTPKAWKKYLALNEDIPTHLTPYNMASIMHYYGHLTTKNPIYQMILDTRGATLSSCDWNVLNILYPGPMLPPPCNPNTHIKACKPIRTCPFGRVLCTYMCDLDCDAGLPRGDIPDRIPYPPSFCKYINDEEFPPLPESLEKQVNLLKQHTDHLER